MDNIIINPETILTIPEAVSGLLKGIPASNGIIVGKSLVLEDLISIIPDEKIENQEIDDELSRLRDAYLSIRNEFEESFQKVQSSNVSIRTIIESNLFIINDKFIEKDIGNLIKSGYSSESSVVKVFDLQKSFFKNSKDPILKERSIELDHIKQRLISQLKHQFIDYHDAKNKILVADNVTPTDLLHFVEAGVSGLITEVGGIASHVSIMARAYDLPAVIGIKDATKLIQNSNNIVLDGYSGIVYYNPSFSILKSYKSKIEKIREHKQQLGKLINVVSQTNDNRRITVSANADKYEDVLSAILTGSESIGLMRSETLIMAYGKIPDEETQFSIYDRLAQTVYPKQISIRVFDIGSDKYSEGIPLSENNPALGFRGIRYLLGREDIFLAQLRAIIRASYMKNIKIIIPMISSLSELIKSRELIDSVIYDLQSKDVPIDNNIKVGVMIETPAAVLIADELAKYCDFFSIGTNDLTQYTLAADRDNTLVTDYYDSFHPALLRFLKQICDSANRNNIPVSICGELAGHSAATGLLIGLGITELSVAPSLVLELKNKIINSNYKKLKRKANQVIKLPDSTSILRELEKINYL